MKICKAADLVCGKYGGYPSDWLMRDDVKTSLDWIVFSRANME